MPFRGALLALSLVSIGAARAQAQDPPPRGTTRLDRILVTEGRTAVEQEKSGRAFTVITGEDLQRRQVRYVADASYWIYILHLPLVMLAQVWVQDWSGPWWAKLAGVSFGVFGVCLLTYELLVRHSFMGKWLNGRRIPWGRPVAAAVPAE